MPDIAMCKGVKDTGEVCPNKDKCYRHTATPCEMQSYFVGAPFNVEEGTCQYYWRSDK